MKSTTSDSTVNTNKNGYKSTSTVTSNIISLENIIQEKLPEKLKGKITPIITIKETKKTFKNVCAGCIWWPFGVFSKLPTTNCCSSPKICSNCHIDVRYDGLLGLCGEQLKTGKCTNKYCKRAHVLEVDGVNYTRIFTNKSNNNSSISNTRSTTIIIKINFDITSAKDFPELPFKQNTKNKCLNNINIWNEPLQIIKVWNVIKVSVNKNQVIANKNQVVANENQIVANENQIVANETSVITKVKLLITNEPPFNIKVKLSIISDQSNTNLNVSIKNVQQVIDNDGFILVQRKIKNPTSPKSVMSPILSSRKSTSSPIIFEPNMLEKLRNEFNKSPTFEKVKHNISKKVLKKEKDIIKKEIKEKEIKEKEEKEIKEKILDNSSSIIVKSSMLQNDLNKYEDDSDELEDSDYDYDSDEDYNSKFWPKK